jgi:hypothetical protein
LLGASKAKKHDLHIYGTYEIIRFIKQVSIRTTVNIPAPLYRKLKEQAAGTGSSIRELVLLGDVWSWGHSGRGNVWLALLWSRRIHSERARSWFEQAEEEQFLFGRFTQITVLRLLTTERIMGEDTKYIAEAWSLWG